MNKKLFCSKDKCKEIRLSVEKGVFHLDYLDYLLHRCRECYSVSRDFDASKTSHIIDLAFAEKFIKQFETKEERHTKAFMKLLEDFEENIANHNCFTEEEKNKLKILINSAVLKGEIILLQNENIENNGSK